MDLGKLIGGLDWIQTLGRFKSREEIGEQMTEGRTLWTKNHKRKDKIVRVN